MANVTQKELKDEKELTVQLLKYQGRDYQEWLYLKHQEFNRENSDIFKQLLTKAIKEKNNGIRQEWEERGNK